MTKVFPRDFILFLQSLAIVGLRARGLRTAGTEKKFATFVSKFVTHDKWLSHFYLFVYFSQSASDIKP